MLLLSTFLVGLLQKVQERQNPFDFLQPQIISTAFCEADRAWVVASKSGNLWLTANAGETWKEISGRAVGGKFYTISFINERQGWTVGEGGTIWRSLDGGLTWSKISILEVSNPNHWSFISSRQMEFVDASHGWILEPFGIWRSEDGGTNWKRVLAIGEPGITGQPVSGAFVTSKIALVSSTDGKVFRTEDGGDTWKVQTVFENGSLRDIYFLNERSGWVTGYGPPEYESALYASQDGGETWRGSPIKDRKVSIYSIRFFSKKDGWAVGAIPQGYNRLPKGLVMHTTDGGQNWFRVIVPEGERSFEKVHFSDTLHGWLLARENIYRTKDGGKTWQVVLNISKDQDTP